MEEKIEEQAQVVEPHQQTTASGKLVYIPTYIRSGIDKPKSEGSAFGGEEKDEGEMNPTLQYVMSDLIAYSEEHILPEEYMQQLDILIGKYEVGNEAIKSIVEGLKGVNQARETKAYQLLVKRNAVILDEIHRLSQFDQHFGYNPNFETDAPEKLTKLIDVKHLYNYYEIEYLPEARDALLLNPTLDSIDIYARLINPKQIVMFDDMLQSYSAMLEIYSKQLKMDMIEFLVTVDEVNKMYNDIEEKYKVCKYIHEENLRSFKKSSNEKKTKNINLKNIYGYRGSRNKERVIESIQNSYNSLNDRYTELIKDFRKYDKTQLPEINKAYKQHTEVLLDLKEKLIKSVEMIDNDNVMKFGRYYKNSLSVIRSFINSFNKDLKMSKIDDNLPINDKQIMEDMTKGKNNAETTG